MENLTLDDVLAKIREIHDGLYIVNEHIKTTHMLMIILILLAVAILWKVW